MSGLADAVLLVHAIFVAFVVGGLAVIWIGALRGWQIVRNFHFRVLHMAAILVVCAEALVSAIASGNENGRQCRPFGYLHKHASA